MVTSTTKLMPVACHDWNCNILATSKAKKGASSSLSDESEPSLRGTLVMYIYIYGLYWGYIRVILRLYQGIVYI